MRKSLQLLVAGAFGLTTTLAFGFAGQFAVGMNMAADVDPIEVPFTADATLETAEFKLQTKIYFQSGKVRDELTMEGQNIAYITRPDQGVIWMIMPLGFYMEIPYQNFEQDSEQMQQFKLVEREVVGTEEVNGMATTKYRVIYESSDGRYGGFTWFNKDNIAVRSFIVSDVNGERERVNFEITNLQMGRVDEALFDLPAGVQKFDIGAMTRGLGGAGGDANGSGFGGFAGLGGDVDPDAPDIDAAPAPGDEATIGDEIKDAAEEGAKEAAVDETRRGVRDAVSRGFRGLRDRLRD